MRAALTIAGVELRRFLRDRSNIFFVFLFPLLLVLVLGSQFGGDGTQGRVVVVGETSPLRSALVAALEDDGVTVTSAGADEATEQVARGRVDAALVVPASAAAAFDDGAEVTLEVLPSAQQAAQLAVQQVRTAAATVATGQGQVRALTQAGLDEADARAALADAAEAMTPPTLAVVDVDEVSQEFAGVGQFDLGASGQTLLFVFLISAAGSATLIQTRRLGVMRRVLAAPVSSATALAGQALGRFVIALFQGAYIMLATALLFDVDWGNIALSLLVLAAFAAVAAGAAMVIGAVMDNDSAASGLGVGLGLVLAALGGCMVPLEVFPDTLRTIAHITPHAWAYDAFALIQRHDGTLAEIAPQLGVLAAMALALLALGTWALRRSLSRAL